jgi:hypothetical protein
MSLSLNVSILTAESLHCLQVYNLSMSLSYSSWSESNCCELPRLIYDWLFYTILVVYISVFNDSDLKCGAHSDALSSSIQRSVVFASERRTREKFKTLLSKKLRNAKDILL